MLKSRSGVLCAIALIAASLAFPGCAAKRVTVTSAPSGAELYFTTVRNGQPGIRRHVGQTPVTRQLSFGNGVSYLAEAQKDGAASSVEIHYQPRTQTDYHIALDVKQVTITSDPAGAELHLLQFDGGTETSRRKLGVAPVTLTLAFPAGRRYEVIGEKPDFGAGQVPVELMPRETTVYRVVLAMEEVTVPETVFTPTHTRQGVVIATAVHHTRALLETIERSPNVKSVTRVTNNEDPGIEIGQFTVSPADDVLLMELISKEPEWEKQYVVGTEDTLAKIAAAYDLDENDIRSDNRLGNDGPIRAGQTLRLVSYERYSNVWKQTVGTHSRTRMTFGKSHDLDPELTHDGKLAYFASDRTSNQLTLWRINALSPAGVTKITATQANDREPSIFPDGQIIAFESLPDGSDAWQIWTVQANGLLPSQLREGRRPRVSPDGEKILFMRPDRDSGVSQVWMMSADGSNETQLTQNRDHETVDAEWSPDGQWIVFASDEGLDTKKRKNFDIWIMAADGTRKTQLTTNGSKDVNPVWDREGKTIYFRSNRGGQWNVWRFEPVLP